LTEAAIRAEKGTARPRWKRDRAANPLKGRSTLRERKMPDQKARAGSLPRDPRDTSANVPFNCGGATIVRRAAEVEHVCEFRCKRAGTECCGEWYKRKLIGEIVGGNPTHHLVLTIRWKRGQDPDAAARKLKDAWQGYKLWWNRHNPKKKIADKECWELAPTGRPHLHLALCMKYLPVESLRAWMRNKLKSPQIRIRYLGGKRHQMAYVAKYVGKAGHRFKGLARHSCTRGWDKREPPKDPAPELQDAPFEIVDGAAAVYVHRRISQHWRIDAGCKRGTLIRAPPGIYSRVAA
jgi:hypothetical protein